MSRDIPPESPNFSRDFGFAYKKLPNTCGRIFILIVLASAVYFLS